ncbi:lytic transglycosylase domain-containing protein [Pedobacter sp. BS3]|uniref:lytic transglycosylase domain-containing protein n=1 Tax=Pedobacter sp. BS3 TaxID=2567937 RepID=UPI0011EE5C88|nr:lytic transglycosylase domain-containing protein [Pedobacter sp. BS3]TZF81688.1 lytic transglycosylase domain-containing protein [Pedobacter sp. BS3]
MIKKHLVACSVMLIVTLSARIAASIHTPKKVAIPQQRTAIPNAESFQNDLESSLNFANEDIPVGDAKIDYRMTKILNAHRYSNLQTMVLHRKAAKWFPVIEPILEMYGIPNDFKYIPLVESGLRSGTSPKGASGYWQFMPGTARIFGLKVNKQTDERQDIHKSTVAACKYLRSMFNDLKSWTLVAAAYNLGDVKLKKQINRQNQDNYFKLRLNPETGTYVYKLICMKMIIEHPARYGYVERPALLASVQKRFDGNYTDPLTAPNLADKLRILYN